MKHGQPCHRFAVGDFSTPLDETQPVAETHFWTQLSCRDVACSDESTLTQRNKANERALTRLCLRQAMLSAEARQQAQTEGLTLRVADNKAGYFGVNHQPGRPKPYLAGVWRGGKQVSLGRFATAEEAALCVARSPEGREAAERAAAAPVPLTSEEARQQAQAERLTLRVAENKTGYFGVTHQPDKPLSKPYQAQVRRSGKAVY